MTPSFWPRFSLYVEPTTYEIRVQGLRRTFVDAFWFIALALTAHAVAELHARGWLPDLLRIW
jgi:hypothetical protein